MILCLSHLPEELGLSAASLHSTENNLRTKPTAATAAPFHQHLPCPHSPPPLLQILSPPPNALTNPAWKEIQNLIKAQSQKTNTAGGKFSSAKSTRPNTCPGPLRSPELGTGEDSSESDYGSAASSTIRANTCFQEAMLPKGEGSPRERQRGRGEGAAGDAGKGCVTLCAWQPAPGNSRA